MGTPAIEPRHLRVSDDERSHVLKLLEKATGRGLIDLGEFNDRSARVIVARTREDLNSVLLDLPGLQIAGRSVDQAQQQVQHVPPAGPGYSGAPATGYGPGQTLELTGWGSRSFKGHWTVPAHIVISGTGASTRLGFSQATLTSQLVTVEFRSNYGGSSEFILPRGGSVRFEGLSMRGGSVQNKIPPGGSGVLELRLTGVKKAGSVVVRYPRQGLLSGWR